MHASFVIEVARRIRCRAALDLSPAPHLRARAACLVLMAACFAAAGCSTVEPWERGHLARAEMAITPDPEGAWLHSHVQTSREAAQGNHGAGGGGCGCN